MASNSLWQTTWQDLAKTQWRLSMYLSDDTPLVPVVVPLPENFLVSASVKSELPDGDIVGIASPILSLEMNMRSIGATQYDYLRERLYAPTWNFLGSFSNVTLCNNGIGTVTTNLPTGQWDTIAQGFCIDFVLPSTPVDLFLSTLAMLEKYDEENETWVDCGTYIRTPTPEREISNGVLKSDFVLVTRYVLEQIQMSDVVGDLMARGVYQTSNIEVLRFANDDASSIRVTADNTPICYLDDFFETINLQASQKASKLLRKTVLLDYERGWLKFAKFYEQQEQIIWARGAEIPSPALGFVLADAQVLYAKKTLFDFFVDLCECGVKAEFYSGGARCFYATDFLPIDITTGDFFSEAETYKLGVGFIGAVECEHAKSDNARFDFGGAPLSEQDYALAPYFTSTLGEFTTEEFTLAAPNKTIKITGVSEGLIIHNKTGEWFGVHPKIRVGSTDSIALIDTPYDISDDMYDYLEPLNERLNLQAQYIRARSGVGSAISQVMRGIFAKLTNVGIDSLENFVTDFKPLFLMTTQTVEIAEGFINYTGTAPTMDAVITSHEMNLIEGKSTFNLFIVRV